MDSRDPRPHADRDAQRRRVYLAETPLPSSPSPGIDACASFVDHVVGTLWWHERFPERDLGRVATTCAPATAPGRPSTARRTTAPPSRCRAATARRRWCCTSSSHWALGIDSGLPHHGRTFARVLLDGVHEFLGPDRGDALGRVVPRARRARGRPAAPGARRPPPLRLGRAAASRQGPRCSRCRTTADATTCSSVPGVRRVRAWLVGAALRRCWHGNVRARGSHQGGVVGARCRLRAPTAARSSPRSSPTSASRSSKFVAFVVTGSASMLAEGDPLRRRHRQPGPAVPRRQAQPQGAHRGAPVRLRHRALLLGVRRRAGALHPRLACSRSSKASTSSSTRTSSSRRSGRSACSASRSCSRGCRCAPRAARRCPTASGRTWWRFIRTTKSPELPVVLLEDTGALVGLAVRARSASASPRSPATRAGTRVGSIGIGLLLGVIAVVLAIEMKSLLIGESASPTVEEQHPRRDPRRPRGEAHHPPAHPAPRPRRPAARGQARVRVRPTCRRSPHAIDTVEARVRTSTPIVSLIYFEPDLYDAARANRRRLR